MDGRGGGLGFAFIARPRAGPEREIFSIQLSLKGLGGWGLGRRVGGRRMYRKK